MEIKRIVKEQINEDFNWSGYLTIAEIKEDLERIENSGATLICIDSDEKILFSSFIEREESDLELQQRINEANKRNSEKIEYELKLLSQLKLKYEK